MNQLADFLTIWITNQKVYYLTINRWMKQKLTFFEVLYNICLGHRLDWVHVLLVEVLKGWFRHDS